MQFVNLAIILALPVHSIFNSYTYIHFFHLDQVYQIANLVMNQLILEYL